MMMMMMLKLVIVAAVLLVSSPSTGELLRIRHPINDDDTLQFLVVGDWGRMGEYNQTDVASQMGRVGEELGIDFVVSTGDNFYEDGLTGVNDLNFLESFADIYTAPSLQKPWFSVLGNHDYRGDVLAQLSPSLRAIDHRWVCFRSFILHSGAVELFFVDTSPFVKSYVSSTKEHYDWRRITPLDEYTANLLKDLDSALRKSKAAWRFVIGHHTLRSVGHHGDTKELVDLFLPILRNNHVDFYINGHDHNLQRIKDRKSETEFLTSGGGSKAWRGDIKEIDEGEEELKFLYDGQGFMSVQITPLEAHFVFYDVGGAILHQWTKHKADAAL